MSHRLVCLALLFAAAMAVAARADGPQASNLPLKRVVLFSSGVGFFEHAGQVNGDAKVEMQFKTDDINDLLKSMVVQDLDGGQVSTVTYGSKDPITKTLKSFSIDLTTNPTLAQLLQQLRGERVVVEAPNEISGIILGVETRKKKLNDHETIDVDVLNLLTDQGLRAVALDVGQPHQAGQREARRRAAQGPGRAGLGPRHRQEIGRAELSWARGRGASAWDTSRRRPSGKPPIGWCSPTSRSRSCKAGRSSKTPPRKIGTTCSLTLVSGRPISFTMDLYQPLYIPRPEEQLELYASLRPQVYGQDLARRQKEFAAKSMRQECAAATAEEAMALTRGELAAASVAALTRLAGGWVRRRSSRSAIRGGR